MKECMRKLAMWYTRTFKPIMTHDELEPIMATLGFVGLPPTTTAAHGGPWKEYVFSAGQWRANSSSGSSVAEAQPRPRLPYPRIDGLHIYTYRAFIDAVNFYLEMCDFSDLFHIRYAFSFFPVSVIRSLFYRLVLFIYSGVDFFFYLGE